jgi:membrane protease YdiL (CAAX protease family)
MRLLSIHGAAVPDQKPRPVAGITWGYREIVIGIVAVLVILFLLTLVATGVVALFGDYDDKSPEMLFTGAIANTLWYAAAIATVIALVRSVGAGWLQLGLRWSRPQYEHSWLWLLGWVVAGYLMSLALVRVYVLAVDAAGLDGLLPDAQIPEDAFNYDAVVIALGLAVLIGAPVVEEVFFRGFLFGGLRQHMTFWAAGLISGGLFSLAHADPGLVLPYTGIGVIFAFLYERTGTLFTPIGVHFIFNGVSFALLVLFPELR